jgi:hypothetical protein
MFLPVPSGLFAPVAASDVADLIRSLDPLPTWLLKQVAVLLSLFLCRLFNWSLERGVVPSSFKSAYITPLLKKADLDPSETKSYRPISNLSILSKLLERLVSKQLVGYF